MNLFFRAKALLQGFGRTLNTLPENNSRKQVKLFDILIANFEKISHNVLAFKLLTLNSEMLVGMQVTYTYISNFRLFFNSHFKDKTRSVYVCFFNIAISPVFSSNTKLIWISQETLMIELDLYIKIYFVYFPGRLK